MKRHLIAVLIVPFAVLLAWIGWMVGAAYVRAPGLVAALEREGALGFSPSDLSRTRLCALVVVQDRTFYRHHGIGLGDGPLGHTTLTQALGKGLFFQNFAPGLLHHRKVELMIAAWAFDRRIPKSMQLRLFLNRAYLGGADGRVIVGFPVAAQAFFGRDLQSLTDREYFSLLAMLEAPDRYHVLRHASANAERVQSIERRVQQACGDGCFQGERPLPCPGQAASR